MLYIGKYVFISCITATSILSLSGSHVELSIGSDQKVNFSRDNLLKLASRLCSILKYEFIFVPVRINLV